MRREQGVLLLICVAVASVPFGIAGTAAQETPADATYVPNSADVQIAIWPTDGSDGDRFELELDPGESATLSTTIQNYGADPLELRTYTSDVLPMINGGLGIAELDAEQHEPTTWMDYPTETMTLAHEESVIKEFTITVPEGAPPGQYINALVLETVNPVESETPSAFEQYYRKVVSVYIVVPGDLRAEFELGAPTFEVQNSRGALIIPISNTGNVRVDLRGIMTLMDAEGTIYHQQEVRLGPIYGGQETYIVVSVRAMPPAGEYVVSAEFADEENNVSGALSEAAVTVPEVATADVAPISFQNVVIEPNGDPIQFANVSVDVVLAQSSFRSTRLTLSVTRNGEFVEEFVLAENLSLDQGSTTVQQRYLPITGWESGTYSFSLTLESTEGETATVLLTQEDVATIEVP